MADDDRVRRRHFVEVANRQRALVLDLGVVEEEALYPHARRRLLRFGAQLVDDAADGDELDVERVADQDLVEQHVAAGVVVTVDEAGDDRHTVGVEGLRALSGESLDGAAAADGNETSVRDGECLGARRLRIHGVDLAH